MVVKAVRRRPPAAIDAQCCGSRRCARHRRLLRRLAAQRRVRGLCRAAGCWLAPCHSDQPPEPAVHLPAQPGGVRAARPAGLAIGFLRARCLGRLMNWATKPAWRVGGRARERAATCCRRRHRSTGACDRRCHGSCWSWVTRDTAPHAQGSRAVGRSSSRSWASQVAQSVHRAGTPAGAQQGPSRATAGAGRGEIAGAFGAAHRAAAARHGHRVGAMVAARRADSPPSECCGATSGG